MSIKKIDDLSYEREFPTSGGRNDTHDIEFTKEGLVIDYDTLSWEDIERARCELFGR